MTADEARDASVKDLLFTRGVRTTMGSFIFADQVPGEDAVPVRRLREAGAILVGKTTTPEFGHKPLTDTPLFGDTRNPWFPEYGNRLVDPDVRRCVIWNEAAPWSGPWKRTCRPSSTRSWCSSRGDWMRHRHVFGSRGSGGVIVLLRRPRSRKNASHSSGRG